MKRRRRGEGRLPGHYCGSAGRGQGETQGEIDRG
jgi:hypothetical protein